MNTGRENNADGIQHTRRISNVQPILTGNDCCFNDRTVDRFEGALRRKATGHPLIFKPFQLCSKLCFVGCANRLFVAVIRTTNELITTGVWVYVQSKWCAQRINRCCATCNHICVTADLPKEINESRKLCAQLSLRYVDVIESAGCTGLNNLGHAMTA